MPLTSSFLYYEPQSQPLDANGNLIPGGTLEFYYTGTTTPAPVYSDEMLQNQFPPTDIESDAMGRFPPVYLDASIAYRRQLYDQYGQLLSDIDPLNTAYSGVTFSATKLLTTSRVSTTSLTSDPELFIAVPSGSYMLQANLYYTGATACGMQMSITAVQSANKANQNQVWTGSTSLSTGQILTGNGRPSTTGIWDAGTGASISGTINVTGLLVYPVSDTIAVYWAPNINTTTALSLSVGSNIYLVKLV